MRKYHTTNVVTAFVTIPAESRERAIEWLSNNFPTEFEITLENGESAKVSLTLEDIAGVEPIDEPAPAVVEYPKRMPKTDFYKRFKKTGRRERAIFDSRPALMAKIYEQGVIYCDQSYYAHEDHLDLVSRDGGHFVCSCYNKFEEWRDCHYYNEYVDEQGNIAWVMTGGRYD